MSEQFVNALLITTGQPSSNPRLMKEAEMLIENNYSIKIICGHSYSWADNYDRLFLEKFPNTVEYVGGELKRGLLHSLTRVRGKICNILFEIGTVKFNVPENAINRIFYETVKRGMKFKPQLIIAHNLGALPAAVLLAKMNKCKIGYDAEDLNSGQYISEEGVGYRLNKLIEEKYFPFVNLFTAASPLIGKEYKFKYPFISPIIINNVFQLRHLKKAKSNNNNTLKLFWFSQTIGKGRGLEDTIAALNLLNNSKIELHLLGYSNLDTETYFRKLSTFKKSNLYFHSPIHPDDIFDFSNQFDIGLALELKTPLNRDICLTNKIFSYLISGLAIIASDTLAQKAFMEENREIGFTYNTGDYVALSQKIDYFFQNRDVLNTCKMKSSELASEKYNWEKESELYMNEIALLIPQ